MNTKTPTAYPLQWPVGWPVTQYRSDNRKFKTTLSQALNELQTEVRLLGGKSLILSSNYTLGTSNPQNPGVVAYFNYDGLEMAIPCDRWTRIEHNVWAISKTINAMRGMESWGAKHMIRAMFSGFKALPAPPSGNWWEVLGIPQGSQEMAIKEAFRLKAKQFHPDVAGGSNEAMRAINAAYEQGLKSLTR